LAHNHNHAPVFHGKRTNSLYSAWLSFFYGCPLFVWVPTHNQNHHRYLDGPGDATRTAELTPRDSLWAALSYPTRSAIAQMPAIVRYVRSARLQKPARFRHILLETGTVVVGHAAVALLAVYRYGWARGALLYGCAFGIPTLFAAWSMMFTNYLQHVGCDYASPDDHSRNFVSPWLNWLVFHAGYHTVHHEHAGTHWSLYPKLHAWRAARIAPALNQRTMLGYCLRKYVAVPAARALGLTETDCDIGRTPEKA
jgi:fatty acid desaturase